MITKTTTLTANTIKSVEYDRVYPCFYVKNLSDTDVYASVVKMTFVADDDDVTCIPAHSVGIVYSILASDTVCLLASASAKVEIIAAFDVNINFNKLLTSASTSADLSSYYTSDDTDDLLDNKVDKIDGKGLSTNDYTSSDKNKLASLSNYNDSNCVKLSGNQTIAGTKTFTSAIEADVTGKAEKVAVTKNDNASLTWYAIPILSGSSDTDGTKQILNNAGLKYITLEGTVDVEGRAVIVAGNNISIGTDGNKMGVLRLYAKSSGMAQIIPGDDLIGTKNFTLPNEEGELALKSQIDALNARITALEA